MSKIQIGQISEMNNNNASCRVSMDDLRTSEGTAMVSGNMQMLFPAVDKWNFFFIPKVGDHVATLRMPNGESEGFILGKPYTAGNMPQGGEEGILLMVSSDGKNVVRLDAINGMLDVVFDQTATMKFKNLKMEVAENADITVGGNVTANITGDLSANANNVTVEAKANAVIKGGSVTVQSSNVTIEGGTLSVNGSVAPTGSGPFCGIPSCLFTGAPHVGDTVTGT